MILRNISNFAGNTNRPLTTLTTLIFHYTCKRAKVIQKNSFQAVTVVYIFNFPRTSVKNGSRGVQLAVVQYALKMLKLRFRSLQGKLLCHRNPFAHRDPTPCRRVNSTRFKIKTRRTRKAENNNALLCVPFLCLYIHYTCVCRGVCYLRQ